MFAGDFEGQTIVKLTWSPRTAALTAGAVVFVFAPLKLASQDQPQEPKESASRSLWSRLEDGNLSFNARYRFEAFERDGTPFSAPAYAPTLRLALGYETPSYRGFSVFA